VRIINDQDNGVSPEDLIEVIENLHNRVQILHELVQMNRKEINKLKREEPDIDVV
tara:strand:- start:668 stop:832 length:165 start_codon:yes stop_codon:yes gene_type:complete